MNDPFKIICPNCFHSTYWDNVCTHCRYTGKQHTGSRLPAHTLLHGRYLVGLPMGQGGFGITYKCYDLQKNELCVVKEYFPRQLIRTRRDIPYLDGRARDHFMHDRQRFYEEAQILLEISRKDYPCVVSVYDYFEANHTSYYVMRYVNGATLKKLLGSYPFKPEELTAILIRLARTMDRIHEEENIVHRDISPENILLQGDMTPVLIDFGSARVLDREKYTVVLKQNFAPIEQYCEISAQGPYTDVYSLAATYYYALTGEHVPQAPMRLGHVEEYVPLAARCRQLGISLTTARAVDRALEVDQDRRTRTMAEFLADLGQEPEEDPDLSGRQAVLRVLDQGTEAAVLSLTAERMYTIGRSEDCDVTLAYPQISKCQMRIVYHAGPEVIEVTEDSSNGSYINDSFCRQETRIYREALRITFAGVPVELSLEAK